MNVNLSIFDLIESVQQTEIKESLNTHQSKQGITYINEDEFFRNSSVDYFRTSSITRGSIPEDHHQSNEQNNLTKKCNFKEKDFEIISLLGNGAYGDVYKAKNKTTGEIFSIKMIDKKMIDREGKLYQIYVENEMLNLCNHPNIIKIYGYYEDKDNFSFIEEYCCKGDLGHFLSNTNNLTIDEIKFISAQLILCLEYLSSLKIIHRDIKPDNFMIDNNFRLKLIDFATATFKGKVFDEESNKFIEEQQFLNSSHNCESFNIQVPSVRPKVKDSTDSLSSIDRNSMSNMMPKEMESPFQTKNKGTVKNCEIVKKQKFVGTAEYMPPEVINNQPIGEYTDIWSLVCIMFQMFTGISPFRDKTEYLIFQNVLQYKYNKENIDKIPKNAYDLIFSILKLNPSERFGYDKKKGYDFALLKSHPFFQVNPSLSIIELAKNLLKKCNVTIQKKETENVECIFDISKNSIATETMSNDISILSGKSTGTVIQDPNGAKVLKSGNLKKRSPYFYYDLRKVVLFDTPRLDYIEPETKIVKGSIPLDKNCKAELVKNNQFLLNTPKRVYSFMCKEKYDITPWVTAINKAINDYCNK